MIPSGEFADHVFVAVDGLCAVPASLLPPNADPCEFLSRQGWQVVERDIEQIALSLVDKAVYRLQAPEEFAPLIVDCSSFIKWVFGQMGVTLPRLAVQQRMIGERVDERAWQKGDLVFRTGPRNYSDPHNKQEVGHVGMVLADGRIVHANAKHKTVSAVSLPQFLGHYAFRGACRILPDRYAVVQVPREDASRWTATRIRRLLNTSA